MSSIADLVATLKLDSSQFKSGLNEAKSSITSFSNSASSEIKKVATIIGAAFAFHELKESLSEAVESMRELGHSAERLGVGVEAFQRLKFAAEASGISADQLNTSLKFMEKNLGQIETGAANSKLTVYFKALGLSVEELSKLPVEEKFAKILTSINAIQDPLEKTAVRMAFFGRGGIAIGSLGNDLQDLETRFDSLGATISGKQIQSVDEYGKKVLELTTIWQGFKNHLVIELIPTLEKVINWIEGSIKKYGGLKTVIETVILTTKDFIAGAFITWKTFNLEIDLALNGIEKLLILFLKLNEITTLGISKLLTPIDSWIEKLQSDIDRRSIEQIPQHAPGIVNPIGDSPQVQAARNLLAAGSPIAKSNNSSLSSGQELQIRNNFTALEQQRKLTEEYKKQLTIVEQQNQAVHHQERTLQDAVRAQQLKVNAASQEKSILEDLIAGRDTEAGKLKFESETMQSLAKEIQDLNSAGFLNNSGNLLSQVQRGFDAYNQRAIQARDSGSYGDQRLSEILSAMQRLTNPNNQFGSGITDKQQKVNLDIKIAAEEGFKAVVARSDENKKVIQETLKNLVANSARGDVN